MIGPDIQGVTETRLPVADPTRSIRFYRDVPGLTLAAGLAKGGCATARR